MPKFFQEQLHVGHAAVGLQLATLHVAAFGLSIAMKDRVDAAVNGGRLSLRYPNATEPTVSRPFCARFAPFFRRSFALSGFLAPRRRERAKNGGKWAKFGGETGERQRWLSGVGDRGVRRRAARGGYGVVAVGTMAMAMAAGRSLKPPALAFTLLLQVAWVGVTAQTFGHIGNYCKRSSSLCLFSRKLNR
eukprot:COSAG04_NODE_1171_length_7953_cov_12.437993_5_plen_190_part_00